MYVELFHCYRMLMVNRALKVERPLVGRFLPLAVSKFIS